MHKVQSGYWLHLLKMFSFVDGRRQTILFDPSIQQTTGQGEPKMTISGVILRVVAFRTYPVAEQRKKKRAWQINEPVSYTVDALFVTCFIRALSFHDIVRTREQTLSNRHIFMSDTKRFMAWAGETCAAPEHMLYLAH